MNKIIAVIAGVLILGAIIFGGTYNNLVTKNNAIAGQWAQVESQYQRRIDLIPNLVSATEGFLKQEREIFENIANARTRYSGAQSIDDKAESATELESALGRLLVIVENYPNLKSNETVARLTDELAGTENRISVERRRFNELVQEYNTTISKFPANLYAPLFGFGERAYFQPTSGAEKAPKVEL